MDRPYLLLTLTSLFWAINIVLGRFAAPDIPPLTLAFLRWFGATLVVLPFAWKALKADWPVIRSHLLLMTALSATGIAGYNALAYWGLGYTEALNALLVQSTGPLLIALWGWGLWGDKLSPAQFLGIMTSLTGVLVIITRGDFAHLAQLKLNPGDILTFAALVLYGLYAALIRARPAMAQISFLATTIIGGAILLLPFAAGEFFAGYRVHVTASSLAVLAYVAVFPSLIAYMFFVRSVELIGPNRASPFFHLMPVFGSVIAILFLGEQPQIFHALGFALVLGGVFVATRRPKGAAL
ncbi:DMT transporter permease [Terrihabitans soli]|uniref:DMT transporter permease n=2 Tax=Terrihabitans soli TaxID=708113 RepID=A0A6S6QFM9_9HYPH|nr:DMT transporter permease [Terrihabitans soli]